MIQNEIITEIKKAARKVYETLGTGFLEKVYQNALAIELNKLNLIVEKEKLIFVYYENEVVGEYRADIFVKIEHLQIILEIKIANEIIKEHEVQIVNYLKATNIQRGLIINFGSKLSFRDKFKDYSDLKDQLKRK